MRSWPMLALVGCYAPTPTLGAECAPAGSPARCPSGQVCVTRDGLEVCERSPLGGDAGSDGPIDACETCTPDDTDGDGVPDTTDNCPTRMNPDQADEDGDAIGDACDPCPMFAGSADADGDGIPDLCDPNPSIPGDQILYFEGFASGLPPAWQAAGFVASGGDAIGTAAANQGATLTIARPNVGHLHIWTDATLVSLTSIALGAMGVFTEGDVATDHNIVCQLVGTSAGATQKLRLFDNANGALISEANHAFVTGTRSVLELAQNGSDFTCSATNPGAQVLGTSTFTASSIGLRVRSATASFRWVFVVASPN